MLPTIHIDRVETYHQVRFYDQETLHPLVSVLDFADLRLRQWSEPTNLHFGLYAVFLKMGTDCELHYGRQQYDYEQGTLVFIGPGQVIEVRPKSPDYQPQGQVLLFHPDLLHGSTLGENIHQYGFFRYEMAEALHLSEQERKIIRDCLSNIAYELRQRIDKHSKSLIVSNLELFLNYCQRFYDRQFITREHAHRSVLARFEQLLIDYLHSGTAETTGIPSVGYFAEALHLSPNYFGDLVKKETGINAKTFIQERIIAVAKERLHDPDKSVSQIAHELGFTYPQHFSRLFKQRVGQTPNEYRSLN